MKYHNITEGIFLERPNRFVAYVNIAGKREKVHVKNTGRCAELLIEGVTVYLEKSDNPQRTTAYDLVAVLKNGRMINIDSQAPNRAVEEWLYTKQLFPDLSFVRPETTYGNSRFDFYIEAGDRKIFMEVKGVTLEQEDVVLFPDAPSERALKHVEELIAATKEGYETYVMFVVQMKDVFYFTPNRATQPKLADALIGARNEGVHLLAYDCLVTLNSITINEPVEVRVELNNSLPSLKEKLRKGCLEDIPKPLLKWYDTNRRILPWREEPTPYRVWISEVMLQQTRVEAVKSYFERFMKALPDIESLSKVPEDRLLKLWEGLGYYNRARNLQKAACQIIDEYHGKMPSEYHELLKLRGIGSYTAGAIASIAFGKPYPAVDGNVLRVISRVGRREEDISLPAVKRKTEEELLRIMPSRAGDFNQAMMEIGAMVCIPGGAPRCDICPLAEICIARVDGVQMEYPKKSKKKPRVIQEKTILVIRDENRAAFCKRPAKGLLAGMYEFPSMEGHKSPDEVKEWLEKKGLKIIRIVPLKESKHIFTHREWHMWGYMVRVDELAVKEKERHTGWVFTEPGETEQKYPVPSAFAAYTEYLNIKIGKERHQKGEVK
ncbi:MAG TPA: A/G-specific adenine glycosylase [Lachnospiraceae bacterium]|nr:A/G-specific adenine glycosylase [Lachnospiraceae bacterium]